MISILFGPPLILGLFLILRAVFLNKTDRRALYFMWIIPATCLFAMMFVKVDEGLFVNCIRDLVYRSLSGVMSVARRFNPRIYFTDTYSDPLGRFAANLRNATFLQTVWLIGVGIVFVIHLLSNVRFLVSVRKQSSALKTEGYPGLKVCVLPTATAPFMFWNTAYISSDAAKDEGILRHVLNHEFRHYVQAEPMWNLMRILLTSLFWFHPIIWLAYYLSKKDAEYSCDAALKARYTEEELGDYCRMLLSVSTGDFFRQKAEPSGVSGLLHFSLLKRIRVIKRKDNRKKQTLAFVAAIVLCAALIFGGVHFGIRKHRQYMGDGNVTVVEMIREQ